MKLGAIWKRRTFTGIEEWAAAAERRTVFTCVPGKPPGSLLPLVAVRNFLVKQDSERHLRDHTGETAALPIPALLFLFLSQMTSVPQYVLRGNLF